MGSHPVWPSFKNFPGLKSEANNQVPKAAYPEMATRCWLQKQVNPLDSRVKMSNFTAEITLFTARKKKQVLFCFVPIGFVNLTQR